MTAETIRSTRDRLALALDVDDLVAAERWAREVAAWFGVVKVGLELYSAAGPEAIVSFRDKGFAVFADLKLHDIPTTVQRAARVVGGLGASYLTVHAAGPDILAAAATGLAEGAEAAGHPEPCALGVTVLTSEAGAGVEVVLERARAAAAAGCGGVVCAVAEAAAVKRALPGLVVVTPGIRFAGAGTDDQARPATPEAAVAAGADVLVVGRAVTAADDRRSAAAAVAAALG